DAPAHRLPTRMANIDSVDERVPEKAADQADDAVGGQHLRGWKRVSCRRGALDIVHGFDKVVDAERNRGNQDNAEPLEPRKDVPDRRQWNREAEMRHGVAHGPEGQSAIAEPEYVRPPGD